MCAISAVYTLRTLVLLDTGTPLACGASCSAHSTSSHTMYAQARTCTHHCTAHDTCHATHALIAHYLSSKSELAHNIAHGALRAARLVTRDFAMWCLSVTFETTSVNEQWDTCEIETRQ
jgi:hypothetical protein